MTQGPTFQIMKTGVIEKTAEFVKSKLSGEGTGHDWWHAYRVWKLSKNIAQKEKDVDLFIVELGALFHDIADWKFNDNEDAGEKIAREFLTKLEVSETTIEKVNHIIANISFKGAGVANRMQSKEGLIVQDADRLDALGAIGIARAFAYGGYKGRELYNPAIKPILHESFDAYKKSISPTLNHFYEKLFLLKDLMNTKTARKIAKERDKYLHQFVDRFFKEWEGQE